MNKKTNGIKLKQIDNIPIIKIIKIFLLNKYYTYLKS